MLSDIPGIAVGHWSDLDARTGCTVVLLPPGAVASGEVRGGAPGTREFELLRPERTVARVDAVVMTGGSAFGLAACDGVTDWLAERGQGFATAAGPVPIVVGMVLFDLMVGDGSVRPGPLEGRAACDAAVAWAAKGEPAPVGGIGAGTGATIGKALGHELTRPGGLGAATVAQGDLLVSALVALNAFGDLREAPRDPADYGLVGGGSSTFDPVVPQRGPTTPPTQPGPGEAFGNTTLGVVATNAQLDKVGCLLVAQGAHDGLARAIDPAHTTLDGDAFVAVATGQVEASVDDVRRLAAQAVEAAIRAAANPR